MKATKRQQKRIENAVLVCCDHFGADPALLSVDDVRHCFRLLILDVSNQSDHPTIAKRGRVFPYLPNRPFGFGTHTDWLFAGLNDSHFETVFRSIVKKYNKGQKND